MPGASTTPISPRQLQDSPHSCSDAHDLVRDCHNVQRPLLRSPAGSLVQVDELLETAGLPRCSDTSDLLHSGDHLGVSRERVRRTASGLHRTPHTPAARRPPDPHRLHNPDISERHEDYHGVSGSRLPAENWALNSQQRPQPGGATSGSAAVDCSTTSPAPPRPQRGRHSNIRSTRIRLPKSPQPSLHAQARSPSPPRPHRPRTRPSAASPPSGYVARPATPPPRRQPVTRGRHRCLAAMLAPWSTAGLER